MQCVVRARSGRGGGGMQGRGRGEPRHCPPPAHSLELTAHQPSPSLPGCRHPRCGPSSPPRCRCYRATCLWSPGSQGVAVRRRARLAGTMKVYRPPASGGAAAWCPDMALATSGQTNTGTREFENWRLHCFSDPSSEVTMARIYEELSIAS